MSDVKLSCRQRVGYGLCMSQIALAIGIVVYAPVVTVHVYSTDVEYNSTAKSLRAPLVTDLPFRVGPLLFGLSALAGLFAASTYQAQCKGMCDQDYQPESLADIQAWDLLFWLFCLQLHTTLIAMVCSPVSVWGLALSSILVVAFLGRACAPRPHGPPSMAYENTNLLGIGLAFISVATQAMHSGTSDYWGAIAWVVVFDYLLSVGHTWDTSATLGTVANCRMFYTLSSTMCTSLLYANYAEIGGGIH